MLAPPGSSPVECGIFDGGEVGRWGARIALCWTLRYNLTNLRRLWRSEWKPVKTVFPRAPW